jgi:tetratricopeptide (TPR) repeat protein
MKPLYILIIVMSFYSAPSLSQDIKRPSDSLFSEAGELYSQGKYEDALNDWLLIYNSGIRSAALDYNIGNAYFKLKNVPGSILFYERALLLKPADEDIRYNLQVARTLVVDKFSEIPELFFVTWYNFISLSLSTNIWAIISLISFLLFLLMLSLYIYSKRYQYKVLGFWLAVLMIVFSISTFSFSARNRNLVMHNRQAIIFSPLVNGKSSPDDSGTDLFILHEGTKVSIEDQVGTWYEIRLSDGNKGWVQSDCLKKI